MGRQNCNKHRDELKKNVTPMKQNVLLAIEEEKHAAASKDNKKISARQKPKRQLKLLT